jgi:hypothetical protein
LVKQPIDRRQGRRRSVGQFCAGLSRELDGPNERPPPKVAQIPEASSAEVDCLDENLVHHKKRKEEHKGRKYSLELNRFLPFTLRPLCSSLRFLWSSSAQSIVVSNTSAQIQLSLWQIEFAQSQRVGDD